MITFKEVQVSDRDRLWSIFQKYEYEMSAWYDMDLDESGNYEYKYFDHYFREPGRTALFLYDGEALVGFAMLNEHSCLGNPIDHAIAEFTVFPKYRKRHLGMEAIQSILAKYPGRWEIKFSKENKPAQALWTRAAEPYQPESQTFDGTETVLSFVVEG